MPRTKPGCYNTRMSALPDVLIIGGGVIGLTTAYYLAREGVSVSLVDKGDLGREASWAGAGILAGGHPKRAKSPMGRLRAHSIALFPELSAELRERTGIDNGYLRCGGLELRRSGDALERQRIDNLVREERGEGLHCEVLDAGQLHELEPALAQTLPGAIHFPEMAQVRNPRHVKALIAACGKLGVRLQPGCPVYALDREGERVMAVRTPEGMLRAERFLIAAGSWSDMLLQLVGWQADIRPVRGQIALLNVQPSLFQRVLLAGAQYLVPRPDGRVLVGSTEEEVGFDKRTTAQAIQDLLSLATSLVPGLTQAQVERCWAGLRPGSPDGRPFLGAVPGCTNLFVAAGHFRSGIQLSPGTGLVMKELLLGQQPTVPREPFRLDRTSAARAEPAFRS
jgi:glycine oxidase